MIDNKIRVYVFLSCLFSVIFVASNLIFQKFISVNLLFFRFEISVGLLFYPITFFITDLVTEFYGKKYAKIMLYCSCTSSLFIILLILIANKLEATNWSNIDDSTFNLVFAKYSSGLLISIIAGFFGQIIDIYLYSYLKIQTHSKHLWLRSGLSMILGQSVDSILVVILLFAFNIINATAIQDVIAGSLSFKIISAIIMIPFYYIVCNLIKRNNYI